MNHIDGFASFSLTTIKLKQKFATGNLKLMQFVVYGLLFE